MITNHRTFSSNGNPISLNPQDDTALQCRDFFREHIDAIASFNSMEEQPKDQILDLSLSLSLCLGSARKKAHNGGATDTPPSGAAGSGHHIPPAEPAKLSYPSRDQVWQALQRRTSTSISPENRVQSWDLRDLLEGSDGLWRRGSSFSIETMILKEGQDPCAPLSRQVSSIETALERSPELPLASGQHPQNAMLDLLRKKEIQAQRRQEARKRRRSLLEEKQQKKARQNSGLPRMGSKQWGQVEDAPLLHASSAPLEERRNHMHEAYRESFDGAGQSMFLGEEQRKGLKGPSPDSGITEMESRQQTGSLQMAPDGESEYSHHGSMMVYGAPIPNKDYMSNKDYEENGSKNCPSSCSETLSVETKEAMSLQNEHGDLEATSFKTVNGDTGLLTSMAMASTYPSTFPVLPIAYPFPVPVGLMPMQLGFSFPYFYQCASNVDSLASQVPVPSSAEQFAASDCNNFLHCATASLQSSEGLVSGSSTKASDHEVSEDKKLTPVQVRTSSTDTDKVRPDHASSKKQADCIPATQQVRVPSDTEKPKRRRAKPAAKQDCHLEREQVRQKSLNQDALDQPSSSARTGGATPEESSHPTSNGSKKSHSLGPKPCNSTDMKEVRSGLKLEEGSSESQLASEVSEQEVCNGQAGPPSERPTPVPLPDLHWVSTTGTGPDGKTINGVMYISSTRQVRLVCSCHGKNMSAAEFVQHSGSSDLSNPERSIVVSPVPVLTQPIRTPA